MEEITTTTLSIIQVCVSMEFKVKRWTTLTCEFGIIQQTQLKLRSNLFSEISIELTDYVVQRAIY